MSLSISLALHISQVKLVYKLILPKEDRTRTFEGNKTVCENKGAGQDTDAMTQRLHETGEIATVIAECFSTSKLSLVKIQNLYPYLYRRDDG